MKNSELISGLIENNLFEKTIELSRNEYLKTAGSVDTNLYYIEKGTLKIFVLDEGEERIIRFGYKENIIVSLDSFINEKPSDLYFQALKKTQIKMISKRHFIEHLKDFPDFSIIWIAILEDLVLQQMEREKDLLTNSPKLRYERVLKRSPQLFQEVSNHQIAKYLRMSPETLSRLKNS